MKSRLEIMVASLCRSDTAICRIALPGSAVKGSRGKLLSSQMPRRFDWSSSKIWRGMTLWDGPNFSSSPDRLRRSSPRVGIIDHGQLIACDSVANLLRKLEGVIRHLYPDLDFQALVLPYVKRLLMRRFDMTRAGPEALAGGPIGRLRDGDRIRVSGRWALRECRRPVLRIRGAGHHLRRLAISGFVVGGVLLAVR